MEEEKNKVSSNSEHNEYRTIVGQNQKITTCTYRSHPLTLIIKANQTHIKTKSVIKIHQFHQNVRVPKGIATRPSRVSG